MSEKERGERGRDGERREREREIKKMEKKRRIIDKSITNAVFLESYRLKNRVKYWRNLIDPY